MKMGIDFGTTRTTVAVVDRGNYPVATFLDIDGNSHDHIPTMVALSHGRLVYGFDAEEAALAGCAHVRSFKRILADAHLSALTPVRIGESSFNLLEILSGFFGYLAATLRSTSSFAPIPANEPLECVIGVPAHAHSAQRFLTLDAAYHGGFRPLLLLNEPSAAGLEYTHRYASTINSKRTRVLVYDLGGGTFDASLVCVDGTSHEVMSSHGNNKLGGDDFDAALARVLLASQAIDASEIAPSAYARFMSEVRLAKEALLPQSRWISVASPLDPADTLTISVSAFYEEVEGLVQSTMDTMAPLLKIDEGLPALEDDVAGVYVVGGASDLPVISRLLRSTFGRRVRRSPHPSASTAIGLAIAADPEAPYLLTERLARGLGVFREMDGGEMVSFDVVLPHDMLLRADSHGLTTVTRTYKAAHNVGVFRFAECTSVDEQGVPRSDVSPLDTIYFPFDEQLRDLSPEELSQVYVERREMGPMIQERYTVDAHGIVWVTISDIGAGYERTYSLAKNLTSSSER